MQNVPAPFFPRGVRAGKPDPVLPATVPDIKMEYDRVLNKALERNSFAQNIRRRQLEADYEVATARGNLRSIDLFASVGYTGQNHEFSSAYRDLLDNQIVQVGVKIPILDWGKRRGKVRVAKSNREVVLSRIRQEQMDLTRTSFCWWLTSTTRRNSWT
mgnify:CR=1 FL=1